MKIIYQFCCVLICIFTFGNTEAAAQKIDATSYKSIVDALQFQASQTPPVFPMEAYEGGRQSFSDGLRYTYFSYGERRFSHRTDFHPAIDVAYFPLEIGKVKTITGKHKTVRAPQTYQKEIYAIHKGVLVSARMIGSGYKIVLKHTLEQPYYDNDGRAYTEYYTCYRHVDARTLDHLNAIAQRVTGRDDAALKDIAGQHVFEAGDLIGFVGFNPNQKSITPRSHLDFSLNMFGDPDKGKHIRNYALNPLLLFSPFTYADPMAHQVSGEQLPAYRLSIDNEKTVKPTKMKDGRLLIEIKSGGITDNGNFVASRYFALNAMRVTVFNDGVELGRFTADRHLKLGYNTSSNDKLDALNATEPHFSPPLGEQDNVFQMEAVIPASWLKTLDYDWSKTGSITAELSSIWDGYLPRHSKSIDIILD